MEAGARPTPKAFQCLPKGAIPHTPSTSQVGGERSEKPRLAGETNPRRGNSPKRPSQQVEGRAHTVQVLTVGPCHASKILNHRVALTQPQSIRSRWCHA